MGNDTYTLGRGEGDVAELPEEEEARHLGHQVHDEVVVYHAPGVQLHALQVVGAEVDGELRAADRCREGTRQEGEMKERGVRGDGESERF